MVRVSIPDVKHTQSMRKTTNLLADKFVNRQLLRIEIKCF